MNNINQLTSFVLKTLFGVKEANIQYVKIRLIPRLIPQNDVPTVLVAGFCHLFIVHRYLWPGIVLLHMYLLFFALTWKLCAFS